MQDLLEGVPRQHRVLLLSLVSFAAFFLLRVVFGRVRKALGRHRLSQALPCAPGCRPFFGHALRLAGQCPWDLCDAWSKVLGPFYRFQLFGSDWVVVSDPALMKEVLRERLSDFQKDRLYAYKHFLCLLGTGMVSSDGPHWFAQRKRLSSALRLEIVERIPAMSVAAVDRLSAKLRAAEKDDCSVEMSEEFRHLTLQVISEGLMGLTPQESDATFAKMYLPIVIEANRRVWNPARSWAFFLPFWWQHRAHIRRLDDYISGLVLERWAARCRTCAPQQGQEKSSEGQGKDVMGRVMDGAEDPRPSLRKKDLFQMRDEIKTFVLAGHETSASMLSWALFEMTQCPEVRRKAVEEADAVWGGQGGAPDYSKLTYTEACLREALRKYSVVPTVTRVAVRDAPLGGVVIPKGTHIMLLMQGVHNREDLWPEPHVFRPERFLQEGGVAPYTFLAFIEGPRICLGQNLSLMESKIVLSLLLHRFDFELDADVGLSSERHPWIVPVLPHHGTPVKIRSRKQQKR